jgi:WD40 repeat protein
MKYDAFISYRQETDSANAVAIQTGLQQFAKPWTNLRALNICRDRSDFGAPNDLSKYIQDALTDSKYLIVIASPGSAASQWVSKEIEFWLGHKDTSNILVVHTGGHIQWDNSNTQIDWSQTTALPGMLQTALRSTPYITSIADQSIMKDLSLKNDLFKEKIAGLAAEITGISKKELYGKDLDEHRKAQRYRRIGLWTIILSIVVGTGTSYYKTVQAENERLSRLGQVATSLASSPGKEVEAMIQGLLATDPDISLVSAVPDKAIDGLFAAVQAGRRSVPVKADAMGVTQVTFSPDGYKILTAGQDGTLRLWDANVGSLDKEIMQTTDNSALLSAAFSRDGRRIVAATGRGYLAVWNAITGEKTLELASLKVPIWTVQFSPDGKSVLSGSDDGHMRLWSVQNGRLLADQPSHASNLRIARFSPDGALIATAMWTPDAPSWDGTVKLWDGQTGRLRQTLKGHKQDVRDVEFVFEGTEKYLLTASSDRTVRKWDLQTGKNLGMLPLDEAATTVRFSRDPDLHLAVATDRSGLVTYWTTYPSKVSGHAGAVNDATFSSDGKQLATASDDRTVKIWRFTPGYGAAHESLRGHRASVLLTTWSPDDKKLASGSDDGEVRIWTLTVPKLENLEMARSSACELLRHRPEFDQVRKICTQKQIP